ncbi:MerR family transcriptional regulator [Nocardioides panacisoli]|uniref:MerR family transcriptional regulator n=1 Tax=Nocardioides panacisoli TaxID=627624 RepID=UPI001C62A76F|nr:MerR family transcriptional regulator [Nocardioides panacisoli]QYJ03198.1 MerR family transcriptional regulator [Nocardioides panacisoli]
MVKSEGPDPWTETSDVGHEGDGDLITLDDLTQRVGMSVRTIRFYTTKGLVPPPIRRGRSGFYTTDHVARLELVQELQSHGFTLAAIEKYVAGIPIDASTEDIALRRSMLAPWQADRPAYLTYEELCRRADRELDDDELHTLHALGVLTREADGRYAVAASQLSVALRLLDIGFPADAAEAAAKVYREHGRQIAEELQELFRTMVWPKYKQAGTPPEVLRVMVEQIKPLSVASLVSAYEAAMDETRRREVSRRTGD